MMDMMMGASGHGRHHPTEKTLTRLLGWLPILMAIQLSLVMFQYLKICGFRRDI